VLNLLGCADQASIAHRAGFGGFNQLLRFFYQAFQRVALHTHDAQLIVAFDDLIEALNLSLGLFQMLLKSVF